MSPLENYYNNFYEDLAKMDALGNDFKKIEELLPNLGPGAKILDVGCGYGTVSHELIKRGCEVYGMEINRKAVASIKEKGFKVIEQDITEPFNLRVNFDTILVLDVLEHIFDPLELLLQCSQVLSADGSIIISVPLYFDLIDRLRILLTGSIISYDNRSYGKKLYQRFRSYNYDHIRFFQPKDILEMCKILKLHPVEIRYIPIALHKPWLGIPLKIIANKCTAQWFPSLLAHSMLVRMQKKT